MTPLNRWLSVLLVMALVTSTGVASGVLAQRWGAPEAQLHAVRCLRDTPHECGEWRMLSETPLDPDLIEMLDCTGYVNRSYQNLRTKDTVHLAIVAGPPGQIAVHTPEICYTTQGFHLEQPPARLAFETLDGASDELAQATFAPDALAADGLAKLIAYHGFSDGGPWAAPDRPRFVFGGRPFLMKLQLASRTRPSSDAGLPDPARDFLVAFLPALKRAGIPGR